MTVITASYAQKALIEAGPGKRAAYDRGGSNHFVFIVVLHDTSLTDLQICQGTKNRAEYRFCQL